MAYPSNTLQLVDVITGKPITNATITADTTQFTSDSGGLAVLNLANGNYTVQIAAPHYFSKTLSITLPMTAPLTIKLIPVWSAAVGIIAVASVALGVGAKIIWRK
jgi:uncharacterized membrane protein